MRYTSKIPCDDDIDSGVADVFEGGIADRDGRCQGDSVKCLHYVFHHPLRYRGVGLYGATRVGGALNFHGRGYDSRRCDELFLAVFGASCAAVSGNGVAVCLVNAEVSSLRAAYADYLFHGSDLPFSEFFSAKPSGFVVADFDGQLFSDL